MHSDEDEAEVLFRDSEAPEELVSDQCIGRETAAECVERKQSCDFGDYSLAFWSDPSAGRGER